MNKSAGCMYCNAEIYIKVQVVTKPILAPVTHEDEIMEELLEKTGITYAPLAKRFCPICGREVGA